MAAEIGHIVMQIDGPRCACGNRGCLEALASRTAIERDLRAAVAAGRPTILTELLGGDLEQIRSSVLRQAMAAGDALVTEVLRHAADVIGHACLTVGHLLDPEVIVLGGGVIEACSDFMLPVLEAIVADDSLAAGHAPGQIRVSSLGDDAVLLGATALARMRVGENPLKKRFHVDPAYPPIVRRRSGGCDVGEKSFDADFYISASGKAKRQKAPPLVTAPDGARHLTREHLARPCRDGPQVLFIATSPAGDVRLTDDACLYMRQRAIKWRALPLDQAIEAYNGSRKRKGALIHLT
jgi:glucokinase